MEVQGAKIRCVSWGQQSVVTCRNPRVKHCRSQNPKRNQTSPKRTGNVTWAIQRPTRNERTTETKKRTSTDAIATPLTETYPSTEKRKSVKEILSDPDLEGDPLEFLSVCERFWKSLRYQKHEPNKKGPKIVRTSEEPLPNEPEYDVCVVGGNLGIFVALALQMSGHRVAVIDRRVLQGRTQEWNSSRDEISVLVKLGLLSESELEECIPVEFNPMRVSFKGMTADEVVYASDCLNIGVSPDILIEKIKQKFLDAGGKLYESTEFKSAVVAPNGVSLKIRRNKSDGAKVGKIVSTQSKEDFEMPAEEDLEDNDSEPEASVVENTTISSRMILDCMGHYSNIVKQIRGGAKPDGIVMVAGGCAQANWPDNSSGDILYTMSDAETDMQLFWEAFPARDGRTTYMFTYTGAEVERPTFEQFLDRYFDLMPQYQGLKSLDEVKFKRILFGAFPCYKDVPLKTPWDRVLQVGDSSASQSPLSFGGFGNLIRHLTRLTRGVDQALRDDKLDRRSLRLLQPYQPNLSTAWLFQRAMSLNIGSLSDPQHPRTESQHSLATRDADSWQEPKAPQLLTMPADHINRVMIANFSVMGKLGEQTYAPFLKDCLQWLPLFQVMTLVSFVAPLSIVRTVIQVGIPTLMEFSYNSFWFAMYTLLHLTIGRTLANYGKSEEAPMTSSEYVPGPGRCHPKLQSLRMNLPFPVTARIDAWKYGSGCDLDTSS